MAFTCAHGRGGQHAERILQGFGGILQVDGYAGYNRLIAADRIGPDIQPAYCWAHLWMPPLLQGFSSLMHTPRLRSSIRPVMTMHPASPASMVNPRVGSQSRTTSSKLDAPNGLSQPRSARLCHLVQNFLRICGGSPASASRASLLLTFAWLLVSGLRKARQTSSLPRLHAPSCLLRQRWRHLRDVAPATWQAKPRSYPAIA